MARHSRLQLQVISLYKQLMRVTQTKPSFKDYVRQEFRQNAQIAKTDVMKIEYLLRRGWRQLEMLKSSQVSNAGVFEKEEKIEASDIKNKTENKI